MDSAADGLLVSAARLLRGARRRRFLAEVCRALCDGSPRKAEQRFGWGRQTVAKGLREGDAPTAAPAAPERRGRRRCEDRDPQLAADVRRLVEPRTHADPELKTDRQYTNFSAREVRQALLDQGYDEARLPSERALRDVLNRMGYRLRRIQKGKPLKKTAQTDAIFANVHAVREASRGDPQTLEVSVDTKAKVSLGEYALGGKNTD